MIFTRIRLNSDSLAKPFVRTGRLIRPSFFSENLLKPLGISFPERFPIPPFARTLVLGFNKPPKPEKILKLEKALAKDKKNYDLLCRLAGAWIEEKRYETAIPILDRAIGLNPQKPEAHQLRTVIRLFTGKPIKGSEIPVLKRAIRLNPNFVEAYFRLEQIYFDQKNYPEVIEYGKAVIEKDPKHLKAYQLMIPAYVILGYNKLAFEICQKILTIDPQHKEAKGWEKEIRGGTLFIAKAAWEKYQDGEKFARRGEEQQSLSDLERAVNRFKEAIQMAPGFGLAYYRRGVVFAWLGNFELAVKNLKKAVELLPEWDEKYIFALWDLGNVYGEIKEIDLAITVLKKGIELAETKKFSPQTMAVAYYNLGVALTYAQKPEEAIEFYLKTVKNNPDYINAWCNLGASYASIKRFKEAVEALKTAEEKASRQQKLSFKEKAQINFNLASAYWSAGEIDKAAEEYIRVMRIDPQGQVKSLEGENAYQILIELVLKEKEERQIKIFEKLFSEKEHLIIQEILKELSQIEASRILPLLTALLESKNPLARSNAIFLTGELGDESSLGRLSKLLETSLVSQRKKHGKERSIEIRIIRTIIQTVCKLLRKFPSRQKETLPLLLKSLDSRLIGQALTFVAVIEILAETKNPRYLPYLEKLNPSAFGIPKEEWHKHIQTLLEKTIQKLKELKAVSEKEAVLNHPRLDENTIKDILASARELGVNEIEKRLTEKEIEFCEIDHPYLKGLTEIILNGLKKVVAEHSGREGLAQILRQSAWEHYLEKYKKEFSQKFSLEIITQALRLALTVRWESKKIEKELPFTMAKLQLQNERSPALKLLSLSAIQKIFESVPFSEFKSSLLKAAVEECKQRWHLYLPRDKIEEILNTTQNAEKLESIAMREEFTGIKNSYPLLTQEISSEILSLAKKENWTSDKLKEELRARQLKLKQKPEVVEKVELPIHLQILEKERKSVLDGVPWRLALQYYLSGWFGRKDPKALKYGLACFEKALELLEKKGEKDYRLAGTHLFLAMIYLTEEQYFDRTLGENYLINVLDLLGEKGEEIISLLKKTEEYDHLKQLLLECLNRYLDQSRPSESQKPQPSGEKSSL